MAATTEFGVSERFRLGDRNRVRRALAALASLGVQNLRVAMRAAEYRSEEGADWTEWLLPTLAAETTVMTAFALPFPAELDDQAGGIAGPSDFLDWFLSAHGEHVEGVELKLPTGAAWSVVELRRAVDTLRRHGKGVVLSGLHPDAGELREIGDGDLLDAVDAVAPTVDGEDWSGAIAGMRARLGELRPSRRPEVWVVGARHATVQNDEAGQARALHAALGAGADRVYWDSLLDVDRVGPGGDDGAADRGLFTARGEPKLAARAMAAGGRERLAGVVDLAAPTVVRAVPRVVVTGGAGFLGANLVDRLAAEGTDVLVVDSLARGRVDENLAWLVGRHRHRVAVEVADVRDAAVAEETIRGARAVIHLAAQVAVTTSVVDPVADFEVNARGTLNVLEAVRHGAPDAPVLFASTNKVYGELIPREAMVRDGERYLPRDAALRVGLSEATPLSFHSPYGCSKGVADQYVLDYARVYGLRTAVFRMSCLYGPRQFGTEDQGWVAHFLIAALGGQPITIFGDGYQVRDLLYVDDAVAAYRMALADMGPVSGRAFNLGGGAGNAMSLRELLAAIPELTGATPDVRWADWRPGDQAWYVSDTAAFAGATGWRAAVSVPDGLRRLTAWLRASVAERAPVAAERIA